MKYTVVGMGVIPGWLKRIIEGISYKPGWSLYVSVHNYFLGGGEPYMYSIAAQCTVEDIVTRNPITLNGPGFTIHNDHREEKMVVEMIFRCIRELESHEMEEQFLYNGIRIFDPHRERADKEKLFELAALNQKPESELRKMFPLPRLNHE